MPKRLLIVWIYHKAVGHVVEALSTAAQYQSANPGLEISLLLNSKACLEFLQFCPWVSGYYSVNPSEDPVRQLHKVPKEWDYVVFPKRLTYKPEVYYTSELLSANNAARDYFVSSGGFHIHGDPPANPRFPGFDPDARFRMELPVEENGWARDLKGDVDPCLTVMLDGAGPASMYPGLGTWGRVFDVIRTRHPRVKFWITGVSSSRRHGWAGASRYNGNLGRWIASRDDCENLIDVGIVRQMAFIQESDVFLSPHTGFAFLAPCLGTPWLAMSGGSWGEDFFARMPFYCSLPRCSRYPCAQQMKWACRVRKRLRLPVECMSSLSKERLDQIADAVGFLAEARLSFDEAFSLYRDQAVELGVDVSKLWRIEEYFKCHVSH